MVYGLWFMVYGARKFCSAPALCVVLREDVSDCFDILSGLSHKTVHTSYLFLQKFVEYVMFRL